jgi:hypothetical protein
MIWEQSKPMVAVKNGFAAWEIVAPADNEWPIISFGVVLLGPGDRPSCLVPDNGGLGTFL